MAAQTVEDATIAQKAASAAWLRNLFFLLLAAVLVRLPFMFATPMSQAPDELTHFWVIKFIKQHLRLPTPAEITAAGPEGVYGSLPQLGYLPHILLSLPAGCDSDMALAARFGSMIAGLVTVYAAYRIASEIFAGKKVLRLCLPALVVFHPQLAFLNSYSNSDSTAVALGSLVLLSVICTVKQGLTYARSLLIGLLLGWLALSKYSGLAVAPVAILCMVASARLHKTPPGKALSCLLLTASAGVGLSLWWFWRSYCEFGGDFLGTKTMYRTWALAYRRNLDYYLPAASIVMSLRWWRMMFFSFWGLFGYMDRYLWRPVYLSYLAFLAAAAGGWLKGWFEKGQRSKNPDFVIWVSFVAIVLINLAAMVFASTANLGGPQGRYLFTAEIPVMALFLGGLDRLPGAWGRFAGTVFVGFNALVCLGAWIMLFCACGFHLRPL